MKRTTLISISVAIAVCSGCGGLTQQGTTSTSSTQTTSSGSGIGNIFGSSGKTIGNVLQSVIGSGKLTEKDIAGTWKYSEPGVAFTSEDWLAKAGGEVAASKVRNELAPYFSKYNINSSNTSFTFGQDKTFSATLSGKTIKGTYTYDESTNAVKLKTLLVSFDGFVTRTTGGISLLFESKKVLTLLQTLGSVSNNESVKTLSDLSKNYEGVRVGFDLTR